MRSTFTHRTMPRALRIAKKAVFGLLILMVLLVGSVFAILRLYEEEVVGLALGQLGKNLRSKAHIEHAELRYWKTFPYVSIHFREVTVHQAEPFNPSDTLLYAKSLYLGFSIYDLFTGRYVIRDIRMEGGLFHLASDKKGNDNWRIWHATDTASQEMNFGLERIVINGTSLSLRLTKQNLHTEFHLETSTARLDISSSRISLRAEMEGEIKDLDYANEFTLRNHGLALNSALDIDRRSQTLTFGKSQIKLDQLGVSFEGSITPGEKTATDLAFSGTGMRIDHLLSVLPESQRARLAAYDPAGKADIRGSVKSGPSVPLSPQIEAELVVSDGRLNHRPSGQRMDNIQADIGYTRKGNNDHLHIRSVVANLGAGSTRVSGYVKNTSRPELDLQIDADGSLSDVREFLVWDTLDVCDGSLSLRATVKGRLPTDRTDSRALWNELAIGGHAHLDGGTFQLKHSNRKFHGVSGALLFNGTSASVQQLRGYVNGSDFELNGTANNLLPYLLTPNEKLHVDASLSCNLLDFDQLTETSANATEANWFALPTQINLQLRTAVRTFRFKTFTATQINGVTELRNGAMAINPVSFRTADGDILARLQLKPDAGGDFLLESTATLKDINIQKFFSAFDNFGQDFLSDRHLKGVAQAEIFLRSPLSASLRLNQDAIFSLVDLRIDNGELIGLEALQNIAQYVGDNKWLAPFVNEKKFGEKLQHIRFSTLENTIRIEKGVVHIPQMAIRSSVMDISVTGTHSFDSRIDYTIGFRLRDILVHRDREWEESDDGLGRQMFVFMRGTTVNPTFGIDKDTTRKNKKEVIAEEVKQVKSLLRDELGFFRKSAPSSPFSGQTPANPGATTTVEWGEENPAKPSAVPRAESKPAEKQETAGPEVTSEKKKVPRWLKEREEYEKD